MESISNGQLSVHTQHEGYLLVRLGKQRILDRPGRLGKAVRSPSDARAERGPVYSAPIGNEIFPDIPDKAVFA